MFCELNFVACRKVSRKSRIGLCEYCPVSQLDHFLRIVLEDVIESKGGKMKMMMISYSVFCLFSKAVMASRTSSAACSRLMDLISLGVEAGFTAAVRE